jgi:uncharacterized protein (DUF1501 family)
VKGGHYGTPCSLTALDGGDNLIHTADFRRSYATAVEGWLRVPGERVLKNRFEGFPVFG